MIQMRSKTHRTTAKYVANARPAEASASQTVTALAMSASAILFRGGRCLCAAMRRF